MSAVQIEAPYDGQIKTVVEYRKDEAGRTIKTTRKIRMKLIRTSVRHEVAERKAWKKFGDAINDPPGPNTATTILGEPVHLVPVRKDVQEAERPKVEAKTIQCSICQGPHWTARCPHKEKFAESSKTVTTPVSGDKADDGKPTKYIPPALRARMAAEAAGEKPPALETYAIRLSNLEPITSESDVRMLCTVFGPVTRVYVSKDQLTGKCKGSAFVNFMSIDSATRAVAKLNGYAYGNIILKAEPAKPQQ